MRQDFKPDFTPSPEGPWPCFRHLPTGIDFVEVPGGVFPMGLSPREEAQARAILDPPPITLEELRPVRDRSIPSMWVSVTPVLEGQVTGVAVPIGTGSPALLEYEPAESFAKEYGFRLPTEAEWEYFCRAGSRDLFVWGPELLPEEELDPWLKWDFSDLSKVQRNRFGLAGLFSGEWCSDFYRPDHSDISERTEERVIKGGGAYFWPWQDCGEWVWCMPAIRMPSSDLDEKVRAFRLICDLES